MKQLVIVACSLLLLSACVSSVNQVNSVGGRQISASDFQVGQGFSNVSVKLNEEAKAKLPDNVKFSAEKLRTTMLESLGASDAIRADAVNEIEVVITDIRTRSNFNAIAFGFLAGDDRVAGVVTVYNKQKLPIKSFEIAAHYALGGIGGGLGDTRMSWLYEEFTKLTLKELLGGQD